MKQLITIAVLAACSCYGATAQSLTAGLRSGASCWSQRTEAQSGFLEAVPGQHLSWDKELFVRWERKSRWAFEAGVSHSALTRQRQFAYDPANQHSGQVQSHLYTKRSDHFDLTLSAQYNLTCAGMQACPLMKRLRSYAGLSITPSLTRIAERREYESFISDRASQEFQAWVGLSHILLFEATKHLVITSTAEGRTAPAELLSSAGNTYDNLPAARFSFRLGAGYRF